MLPLTFSGKCTSGGSIPFLGAAKFQVDIKEVGKGGGLT